MWGSEITCGRLAFASAHRHLRPSPRPRIRAAHREPGTMGADPQRHPRPRRPRSRLRRLARWTGSPRHAGHRPPHAGVLADPTPAVRDAHTRGASVSEIASASPTTGSTSGTPTSWSANPASAPRRAPPRRAVETRSRRASSDLDALFSYLNLDSQPSAQRLRVAAQRIYRHTVDVPTLQG